MSQRPFKSIGMILCTAVASSAALLAQAPRPATASAGAQSPPPLEIRKIQGNMYLVKGGLGANAGFYISDKEVTFIDAKMSADSVRQMLEEVQKLTPLPVTRIILTHSDGDHVNGLSGFPEGIEVVAQEQTRRDLEEAFKSEDLKAFLPTRTFRASLDIRTGKSMIRLFHFGPAHTSGDAVVFFPEEKAAFVGDLAFLSRDPLVHRHKKGNSLGLVRTLLSILNISPEAGIFVSGHDDPLTRADLEGLSQTLAAKREKIQAMIAGGNTLEEVKRAFGIADLAPQPGRMRFPSLVEVIYLEITEK